MRPPLRRVVPAVAFVILLLSGSASRAFSDNMHRTATDSQGPPIHRLSAPAFNSIWESSSGVRPDAACPSWDADINDSLPQFTAGAMRIHTPAFSKNAYYSQSDTSLVVPDTLIVEARLRFGDGVEDIGPCGHYRQAAFVAVTAGGADGTALWIGNDEIFIPLGQCDGINRISTPTTDAAHTYRIVLVAGDVSVYRDGILSLTGHTYHSVPDFGSAPAILWGEGSILAYGTSYWESVKHNAHATGCAATGVDRPSAGAGPAVGIRAWPNPARAGTRVEWTLAKSGAAHVGIFDLTGRLVRPLHAGVQAAGIHGLTWDGTDSSGAILPPGIYLCRVETRDGLATAKLLLLAR